MNGERQPVVYVNFNDAKAYAAWLTERDKEQLTGFSSMNELQAFIYKKYSMERDKAQLGGMCYRVPTEDEWQAFAQCGDNREFPWGNAMPPKYGNYNKIIDYDDGYAVTCPVENSGRNDWGLYGVGGNVWEACATDASGSSFGAWRGASWSDGAPDFLRCVFRGDDIGKNNDGSYSSFAFMEFLGFRLVLSRPAAENEKKRKQQEEEDRLAEEKRKQEALSAEQERLKAEAKKVADDRKRLEDEKVALAEASRIERERIAKEAQERIDTEKQAIGPKKGQAWASPATGMEFVWVSAMKIWVGKYEVTNGEYRKKESGHDSKDYKGQSMNGDRQPVVYVNFDDAKAYAAWLTEKDKAQLGGLSYRLPSETEWMVFAQCGDGRKYPWGDSVPPKYGNYSKSSDYDDRYVVSCPVDKSGKNEWGLYGVGGNVWECCVSDASGSSFGAWRGASWGYDYPDVLRCAARGVLDGMDRNLNGGFRLVLSKPSP